MRGFYFNTEENTYYYNDIDGVVKHVKEKRENEFILSKYISDEYYTPVKVDKRALQHHLLQYGYCQMTLIVTEACNIRCKYCVYSGAYKNSRLHADTMMTFEIAKKSCDSYLIAHQKTIDYHPLKVPIIGFYGGEPLMNFEVIRKTVEYVNKRYGDVEYTISTNATLMNDEIIDFLVSKNFYIAVSLNGDKEENNRLRVYGDGSGTYEKVKENLLRLKKLYPKHVSKCVLLCTIDPGTDMKLLGEFFESGELSDYKVGRLSQVFDGFTDWYEKYDEETLRSYRESIKELREKYIKKLIRSEFTTNFEKVMFEVEYRNILNRNINVKTDKIKLRYLGKTGLCVPGSKIAVSPNGEFYTCERINNARPIGNYETGLDLNAVADMINEYNRKIKKCQVCSIERVCANCYVENIELDGEFVEPNEEACQKKRKHQMNNFIEVFGAMEKGFEPNKIII